MSEFEPLEDDEDLDEEISEERAWIASLLPHPSDMTDDEVVAERILWRLRDSGGAPSPEEAKGLAREILGLVAGRGWAHRQHLAEIVLAAGGEVRVPLKYREMTIALRRDWDSAEEVVYYAFEMKP